jgi:hypothetical protein
MPDRILEERLLTALPARRGAWIPLVSGHELPVDAPWTRGDRHSRRQRAAKRLAELTD